MAMSGSPCCIKCMCSTRHEHDATPATRHLADRGDRGGGIFIAYCDLPGAQCGFATGAQYPGIDRPARVLRGAGWAGVGRGAGAGRQLQRRQQRGDRRRGCGGGLFGDQCGRGRCDLSGVHHRRAGAVGYAGQSGIRATQPECALEQQAVRGVTMRLPELLCFVIPAKAGIQWLQNIGQERSRFASPRVTRFALTRATWAVSAVCALALCVTLPALAQGDGLNGSYWNFNVVANGNAFPSGAPDRTRIDATVNFNWGSGAPAPGIGSDDFAVRWDGMVEAPQTGGYIFSTQSDDGVRLWINGALVIDNWTLHGPTWNDSAPVNLVAGQRYVVRMEMFERGGGAVARLYWRDPDDIEDGDPRNVIKQKYLYSQITPTVLAVVQSCGDPASVIVSFSRPMEPGSGKHGAERVKNYKIKGSGPKIDVIDAVLAADGVTVTLTLDQPLVAGNVYTLEVKDVESS
ncbi:MAG: hypothetical protein COZ47_13255, partial [Lysobacterales bacterium CG_4_10_14_3_um_filter_64_11]